MDGSISWIKDDGTRSEIRGTLTGSLNQFGEIVFDKSRSFDFSLVWQGEVKNGGAVETASRHSDGRLLIGVKDLCYSID